MLIKEEETTGGEINLDALEEALDEGAIIEVEEEFISFAKAGEDEDEVDIAFEADDSRDW